MQDSGTIVSLVLSLSIHQQHNSEFISWNLVNFAQGTPFPFFLKKKSTKGVPKIVLHFAQLGF